MSDITINRWLTKLQLKRIVIIMEEADRLGRAEMFRNFGMPQPISVGTGQTTQELRALIDEMDDNQVLCTSTAALRTAPWVTQAAQPPERIVGATVGEPGPDDRDIQF